MQTSGLLMSNIWSDRVMRRTDLNLARVQNQACEATVMIDIVTLGHHGSELNYRPYLQATGDLISVVPQDPMPWDITEISYDRGQERISGFYEFTDDQLAGLVRKGYFGQDFTVPEEITGIEWQLPIEADAVIVGPSGREDGTNAAIVFLQIHDAADLKLDMENTRYDMAEYFADRSRTSTPQQAHEMWSQRPARTSQGQYDSLFTDEELALEQFEDPRAQHKGPVQDDEPVQLSPLDASAEEIAASIEQEQRDYEEDLANRAGSDENLYASRIASYLEDEQDEEEDEQAQEEVEAAAAAALRDDLDRIGMTDEENVRLFDDELEPEDVEAARTRRTARRQQNIAQALRRPDGSGVLDQVAPEQAPGYEAPDLEDEKSQDDQPQPGA